MPMENYTIATNNGWKQLNTRYLNFHNQCYFFQYLHVNWYPISIIKFKKGINVIVFVKERIFKKKMNY